VNLKKGKVKMKIYLQKETALMGMKTLNYQKKKIKKKMKNQKFNKNKLLLILRMKMIMNLMKQRIMNQ
jgi:hypothetical protein